MPNRNYISGYNLERRVVKYLEKLGYANVVRTAGSHSLVDIIAFDINDKIMKVFQVKKHKKLHDKDKSIQLGNMAKLCNVAAYDVHAGDKHERYALRFTCISKAKDDI